MFRVFNYKKNIEKLRVWIFKSFPKLILYLYTFVVARMADLRIINSYPIEGRKHEFSKIINYRSM